MWSEEYSQEDSFHLWCLKECSEGMFWRDVYMLFNLQLLLSESSSLNFEDYINITFFISVLAVKRILILPNTSAFLPCCLPLTVCLLVCLSTFLHISNASFLYNSLIPFTHLFSISPFFSLLFFSFFFFPLLLLITTTTITITIIILLRRFFEVRFLVGVA